MKIFISYRRAEDNKSYIVGAIHENLSKVFGKDEVFRDIYDITAGSEWRARLESEVNSCKVMLVIIGPDWTGLAHPNGQKRLLDPEDITRWEVETGLRRSGAEKIALIPVLVTGANFPSKEELPESMHELLKKQAITLRNFPDFDRDMDRLVMDIRKSRGFREDDIKIKEYEPKTVYIDEGSFWMGSPEGEEIPQYETPQHEVFLPSFRIGKYPVTNREFEAYVRQKDICVPKQLGWDGQQIRQGKEDDPVSGVTWMDAIAYCRWLSEQTGREYSLPNEAQWEKACRGGNKTIYPWGDEFDRNRCNHGRSELAAVKAYPEQNDFGCFDLVGNVRQWTVSLWGEKRIAPDPHYAYPWRQDRRNDISASRQIRRVVRGSSFRDSLHLLLCSARSGQAPEDPGLPDARHGFRIVMSV
ncbi:MAG TPA: SUMF1/EgtB/PvdO family nonheme iron enzyme [Anaerolineales bacterium]|nr:SUMF1/EgtB/PvdO family nonheme iron enzyme [Anaerolineales bacterium]